MSEISQMKKMMYNNMKRTHENPNIENNMNFVDINHDNVIPHYKSYVQPSNPSETQKRGILLSKEQKNYLKWHTRLGHISKDNLKMMIKQKIFKDKIEIDDIPYVQVV